MLYLAIFNDINKPTGKLCKWATGLADFHVGITDGLWFYDQDILFRRRRWNPADPSAVTLFECPFQITPAELDTLVLKDVETFCRERSMANVYGWRDYIGFALRKFGIKARNFGGVVCSGRVRDIAASEGWYHLGTPETLEPSPADWRRMLKGLGVAVIKQGAED